jgi:hypothetical protein
MQDVLTQLNRVRGVGGSLLLSADGLPMSSALRTGTDENLLAASLAEAISSSTRMCQHLTLGAPSAFPATCAQGTVLLLGAGPAYVAILVDPTANLALLQIEAKSIIERIAQRIAL